jgi:hypothetical protein
MIDSMLQFDPAHRSTAGEVLHTHGWLVRAMDKLLRGTAFRMTWQRTEMF